MGVAAALKNGRRGKRAKPVPTPACLAAAPWLAQARGEPVWILTPAEAGLPCVALPASEARARGVEDRDANDGGRVLKRIEPRPWEQW